MKVTVFEIEGTADELKESPALAAVVERLSNRAVHVPDSDFDVDADDAAAEVADAEASAAPAPNEPGAVPGVSADGQADVREQLTKNPAPELFEKFLADTTSWPKVKVHGIKIRRSPAGAPLDYTRYLRVRKAGSQFGGFVYVNPTTGTIEPRLNFPDDDALQAVAPAARRTFTGHRAYRAAIEIVDQSTLAQALDLARQAYDLT